MIRTVVEGLVSILRTTLIDPLSRPQSAAPRLAPFCESLESRQFLSAGSVNVWGQLATTPAETVHTAAVTAARTTAAATKAPRIVLSAQSTSTTQVKLFWRQPQFKAKRIDVYAKGAASPIWTRVGSVSSLKTGFTARNLAPGTQHLFQVVATSAKGASQVSRIAMATTRGTAASPAPAATSQPIVITQGGTYSGNWRSDNARVPAVIVATSEPVIIENSVIRGRGTLIASSYHNASLTVRNTKGYALNPNVKGRYPGRFIDLEGFVSLTAENNYMEGTSGIYLYSYAGNGTEQQTIKVMRNIAKNIDGRHSDGKDGFLTGPFDNYYVQFFQINGVRNLPGVEIGWNQVINEPGKSRVEDNVSIFSSGGTAASPFRIHNNYIQGAYGADAATETSYTGGGIMLSDVDTAYVHAYDNHVIATTNYGIAISSGHNNAFYNNRIISAGILPDGQAPAAQNVGAYIWNMNGEAGFVGNAGHGNLIGWNNGGGRNDSWNPDAASWTGNFAYPGAVTRAAEAYEYQLWTQKRADMQVAIGPSF